MAVIFVPTQPVTQEDVFAYEREWADKMVEIWREKIMQFRIRHTGRLFESVAAVSPGGSSRVIAHKFLEYGLYQDRGTGKDTPRGNGGDLGHDNHRKRRPWYSSRYYPSVRKLIDAEGAFYGAEYQAVLAQAVQTIVEGK